MGPIETNTSSLLEVDGEGVLCVAGTHVTFASIIHALSKGYTPQEVSNQYPELRPSEVKALMVHYLCNGKLAAG
jgi:uncharacterized protein (DUF433 family)